MNLAKREDQAKLRLAGDESEPNPLEEAEGFPNRFSVLSFFFDEGDGVEITQDLDNEEEVEVYYFSDSGRVLLNEGSLYEWAMGLYDEE